MILPPVQTIRNPEVTVVIPTRNRCNLVARAIRSALQQSFTNLEVVVVVDGPDPETISVLRDIQDDRLRWIEMAQTSGGSSARNAGASAALGRWIAFLDDDDEWFAQKIQKQLALANASSFPYPIV